MKYMIRELRDASGLTQKAFAERYGIPLSTFRKWEQGEAAPAPYFLSLLAGTLPVASDDMERISGGGGKAYYYDRNRQTVYDRVGNGIRISEDIDGVKPQNLAVYLDELFESFYDIQQKFDRDCRYDREDDALWVREERAK